MGAAPQRERSDTPDPCTQRVQVLPGAELGLNVLRGHIVLFTYLGFFAMFKKAMGNMMKRGHVEPRKNSS